MGYWSIVRKRAMEHCDYKAWSIVITSDMSIVMKEVLEHCEERGHGSL